MDGIYIFLLIFLALVMFGGIFYCVCTEGQKSRSVGLSAYNNSRRTGMPNFRRTGNVSTGWSRSRHIYQDTTERYYHDNYPSIVIPVLHGVTIEENGDCCHRNDDNIHLNNDNCNINDDKCNRDDDCCFGGDDYLSNDDVGGGGGDTGGCDSGGGDTGGCDSGGGDTGGCDTGGGDTGGCDSGGGGGDD